jgi:prophage regulatory protein
MNDLALWPDSVVEDQTGLKRTNRWQKRKAGLLPQPIMVGGLLMTPAGEIRAVNAARIRGANDDEIRELVKRLHAERQAAAA